MNPSVALSAGARSLWGAYEKRLRKSPVTTQMASSAFLWGLGDLLAQTVVERKKAFDIRRCVYTAAFGCGFVGPVGHFWYLGLDAVCKRFFIDKSVMFYAAKVGIDTAVLGPLYILAFFAFGSFAMDNTGMNGFKEKVQKDFFPTFAVGLMIWPAFQVFNFYNVPLEHQLLAVNLLGILDATFLSWARSQDGWWDLLCRKTCKPLLPV